MIELLMGGFMPLQTNPLIETEPEPIPIVEIIEPVELTLEEKIAQNFYECDESIEWIRADTAECLPKVVSATIARVAQTPVTTAQNVSQGRAQAHSGWYGYGWCTSYVASQRPVGQWNNASEWVWQAQRDGWATGSTPRVGAIAQKANHVAIVRSVSGNTMTIQEQNYQGFGVVSSRTISTSGWRFIY